MRKIRVKRHKLGFYGLAVNAMGSIVLALSLAEYSGSYVSSLRSGLEYHTVIASFYGLNIGLFLLAFGFVLQLGERIRPNLTDVYLVEILIYVSATLVVFLVGKLSLASLLFY